MKKLSKETRQKFDKIANILALGFAVLMFTFMLNATIILHQAAYETQAQWKQLLDEYKRDNPHATPAQISVYLDSLALYWKTAFYTIAYIVGIIGMVVPIYIVPRMYTARLQLEILLLAVKVRERISLIRRARKNSIDE